VDAVYQGIFPKEKLAPSDAAFSSLRASSMRSVKG